jgi:hypothetical protein
MRDLKQLPKQTRTQLAFGLFLIVLGLVWFTVILYLLAPDQVQPTRDDVRAAYEAFMNAASGSNLWSFNAVGTIVMKGIVLALLDILFVVARYGGLTFLTLGGFAVFEAISDLRTDRP